MTAEVLYQDTDGLKSAKNHICLTFLTNYMDRDGLFYLAAEFGIRLGKIFPATKAYLLKYEEQKDGAPGFEMKISRVPIRLLKEICNRMEIDKRTGKRIADIDVFLSRRGTLIKICRGLPPSE